MRDVQCAKLFRMGDRPTCEERIVELEARLAAVVAITNDPWFPEGLRAEIRQAASRIGGGPTIVVGKQEVAIGGGDTDGLPGGG